MKRVDALVGPRHQDRQHRQRIAARAGARAELEARPVAPLQAVDHHHERRLDRGLGEEAPQPDVIKAGGCARIGFVRRRAELAGRELGERAARSRGRCGRPRSRRARR